MSQESSRVARSAPGGPAARSGTKRAAFALVGLGIWALLTLGAAEPSRPDGSLLLVVNKDDRTLSIVDPRQVAVVPVGGTTGHEVAVALDGRTAWVPIYGDSGVGRPGSDGRSVSVIDLQSHKRIGSIPLPRPARPHHPVFSPRDGRLYVTAETMRALVAIDPVTREIADIIGTGQPGSHMVALSPDGTHAYTANVAAGTVSILDLDQRKVAAIVPVSASVQRIAVSPNGRWAFTADQTGPRVAAIDTTTLAVTRWMTLPDTGYSLAVTHDGRRLLVTLPSADSLAVIGLDSAEVEQVIHLPAHPQEVLIPPGDRVAYVSCDPSKQVAEIDLASGTVTKLVGVGAGADGLGWVPADSHR